MGDGREKAAWGGWVVGLIWVGVVLAGVVGVMGGRVVWGVVRGVGPEEYREANMVLVTRLMLRGENPYSAGAQPGDADLYGIGYPAVVYPLARVFGATYGVHRGVAVACVVGCCLVVGWGMRMEGVRWGLVAVGVAYLWADLGVRYVPLNVMARPDSLGMLLFLLAVVVPWRWRFAWWSLGVCFGLSVMGWLAKPYFLLGWPVVVSYLVLFEDVGKGVWLGVGGMVLGLGVVMGVNAGLPFYLHDTFYVHRGLMEGEWGHVWEQYGYFVRSVPGLVGVLGVGGMGMGVRWSLKRRPRAGEARGWWGRGVLGWRVSVPVYALWVGVLVFTVELGPHPGNGMTYVYQVVSPWAVMVGMGVVEGVIERGGGWGVVAVGAVVLDMVLTVLATPAVPGVHGEVWGGWEAMLGRVSRAYVPGALAEMADRQGKKVWDGGFAEYFRAGIGKEPGGLARRAEAVQREADEALNGAVARREFDVIVVPVGLGVRFPVGFDLSLLRGRYRRAGVGAMPMDLEDWEFHWVGEVWVREGGGK